jgi:hypothetical protein
MKKFLILSLFVFTLFTFAFAQNYAPNGVIIFPSYGAPSGTNFNYLIDGNGSTSCCISSDGYIIIDLKQKYTITAVKVESSSTFSYQAAFGITTSDPTEDENLYIDATSNSVVYLDGNLKKTVDSECVPGSSVNVRYIAINSLLSGTCVFEIYIYGTAIQTTTPTVSTNNTFASPSGTDLFLYTGIDQRLIIKNSNGNVGIGNVSSVPNAFPTEKLDVLGNSVIGSLTERISIGSGGIGFNKQVSNGNNLGNIYNSEAFAYQFQHVGSTSQNFDYLALQVYQPNGSIITDKALVINGFGNVLIGKTTQTNNTYKLDVNGKVNATQFIGDGSGLTNLPITLQWTTTGSNISYDVTNGNVLIGKTTQTNTNYKLDVAGKVRANEVTVNTTGADFVFEKNYKLLSLPEVENYITQHKHLPDISPATEMQNNGVSVGEMQAKLLQKVEELTLYLIELKKENELLKEENRQVRAIIGSIK